MVQSTTADRVEGGVRRSPTFSRLVRGGLISYGLLHLLAAWLILRVLVGQRSSGSSQGALARLSHDAPGLAALMALTAGLAVLAAWQAIAAAVGYRHLHGRHRQLMRLGAACRVVTYAYLAFTTGRLVVDRHPPTGSSPRATTSSVLAQPLGRFVLGAGGIVLVAVGIGLAVFGVRRQFLDQLDGETRRSTRRVPIVVLGQLGYVAKGAAFVVIGVLVCWAAVTDDARKTGGLDHSLEKVVGAPFGFVAIAVVGVGVGCFGCYLLARARHLRRRTLTA